MAASQKRSRKTKLVPRDCPDFAVDKYLLLQEHIQPLLRQIPGQGVSQIQSNVDIQPLLRQTIPGHREDPESFLKFNVQVEVEEYNEDNKVEIVNDSKQTKPARTSIICGKDRKLSNELRKEIATKSKRTTKLKQTLLCIEREADEIAIDIVNDSLEESGEKSTPLPCESNEENEVEMVTDDEGTKPMRTIINSKGRKTRNVEKEISTNSAVTSKLKSTSLLCVKKESDELAMDIVNYSLEDTVGKKSTMLPCENDTEIVTEICIHPESSTEVTETINDPETEFGNDPENNTEATEIDNDPESSTEETEIGNDPDSTEVMEIIDDSDSSTEPTTTLLCVKDRKASSILRKNINNDLGNTVRKHINNYLEKDRNSLSFNELEKKSTNEKKKNTIIRYGVDRATIKEAMNEISKKTTSIADKILEIEVKNLLGKKLDVIQLSYHDNLIQKALQEWRAWYYQSKLRECIVSYKCYICDLAWWHLTPFRYHIRIHEEPKIDLETVIRECHLICYSDEANKKDIEINENCWRCLKSSKKHMFKYRKDDLSFQCEGCNNSFFPCWNLLKHEAICQRYHKIIFKDTVRHESDWKCNICDLNLLTKERFESHLSGYHSVRSDVPLPTPLQKKCYSCNQEYHLFSSHICLKKNCNFQCTNCFRRFQTNWFVEFHLKMTKRNFDCKICHKCLKTQCMEMEHMVRHSDNYVQAYRCLFCEDYVLFSNLEAFRLHVDCAPGHVKKSGTRLIRNYCEIMIVPKSCMTIQSPKIVRLKKSGEKRKILQKTTSEKRKKPNTDSLLKRPDVITDKRVKHDQKSRQDKINVQSEVIIKSDHSDSNSDVELVETDDDDVQVITDDDEHVQLDTDDRNLDETVQVKKENSIAESEDISFSNVFQPSKSVLKKGNDGNRSIKIEAYDQDDKFTYEKMLAKVLQTSGNIPETFTFSTEISDDDFEDDIIVLNTNLIKDSNLSDIEIVNPIAADNLVPDEMVSSNLVPDEIVFSNLVPDDMISSNLELNYTVTSNLSTDKSNKKREPIKNNLKTNVDLNKSTSNTEPNETTTSNSVPDKTDKRIMEPNSNKKREPIKNNPKTKVSNLDLNKSTSNTKPNETTTSNSVPDVTDKRKMEPNFSQIRIKQEPIEDPEHNTHERELNINIIKTETTDELNDRNIEETNETQEDNTNAEETSEILKDNTNLEETSSRVKTETVLDIKSEDSDYSHDSLEIDEEELRFTEISFIRKIVGADRGGRKSDGGANACAEGVSRRKKYKCTICGFQAHHAEYKHHIQNCCPKQKQKLVIKTKSIWTKIKCTKCNETFNKLKNYIAHFSRHDIPYSTCPQCLQRAKVPSSVGPHLLKHVRATFVKANYINKHAVSRNLFQCSVCRQKGILFRDLMQHWEKHLDIKTTEKPVEPKVEDSDDDFAVSAALSADSLQKLTVLLQLPTATYNSGKRSIANDVRVCSLCNKSFGRRTDCKRHLIEHLLIDALANKQKYSGLRCQICQHLCARSDTYRKHMRDHGFLPIYKCELCNKSFSDSSNFAKHKKVHNLMCLTCDICQKKFHSKLQLIKHIEYHKTTEPIQCKECDRISYSVSVHKKHMKHHSGVTSFRCPICRHRFDTLKLKWEHMWVKHGERNVKADCPVCNMQFRTLQMLKTHLKDDHDLTASFTDIVDGLRQQKRTFKTKKGSTSRFQLRDV